MKPTFKLSRIDWQALRLPVLRYLQSILLVVLASIISIPIHFLIEPVNLVMIYLVVVLLAGLFLGRGPAALASVLSVLMFDFFLVQPRFSFSVDDAQYLLTFFGLLTVGLIISNSAARLREQLEISRRREAHTSALNSLSQDLTGAVDLDEMLRSVVYHVSQTLGGPVAVLLPEGGRLKSASSSPDLELDEAEIAAAEAAFHSQHHTGRGTENYPEVRLYYFPLTTALEPVGVLAIKPNEELIRSENRRQLLQGFANLAALAIERVHLAEQASQAQVLKNTERLQSALLSSISHELRTPLVSITGALSTLAEMGSPPGLPGDVSAARKELVDTAYGESQRLNLLVGNLLDISRLEAGAYRLSLEPVDIQDLVGIALQRFAARHPARQVQIKLVDGLPLLDLDVSLMVQVLENLLENAAKYSPDDSPLELESRQHDGQVLLTVCDRGIGIPAEDLDKVFDKFYRTSRARRVTGLGLGLSICKGIVEAHDGRIWVENRSGGGVIVNISLPAMHDHSMEPQ